MESCNSVAPSHPRQMEIARICLSLVSQDENQCEKTSNIVAKTCPVVPSVLGKDVIVVVVIHYWYRNQWLRNY